MGLGRWSGDGGLGVGGSGRAAGRSMWSLLGTEGRGVGSGVPKKARAREIARGVLRESAGRREVGMAVREGQCVVMGLGGCAWGHMREVEVVRLSRYDCHKLSMHRPHLYQPHLRTLKSCRCQAPSPMTCSRDSDR